MKYTPQEVMQYIEEEDVKFIRLAFCDVHGHPKNISIMPHELERAFKYGIAIDGSAIAGFGDDTRGYRTPGRQISQIPEQSFHLILYSVDNRSKAQRSPHRQIPDFRRQFKTGGVSIVNIKSIFLF